MVRLLTCASRDMQLLDFGQIESKERIFNLFPDTDKFTFDPFIRTLCFRRIIEANMQLYAIVSLHFPEIPDKSRGHDHKR